MPDLRSNIAKSKNTAESSSPSTPLTASSIMKLLDAKLNEQRNFFTTQLKETEDRIMQRLGDVTASIANIRSEFDLLAGKVVGVVKQCDTLCYDVGNLRAKVSALENDKVATDVVIFNVPNKLDAVETVNKIVAALPSNSLSIKSAFRTGDVKRSEKAVPIIAKLHSVDDRVELFRALAKFRKAKSRQLQLNDLGMQGSENIILHECLSTGNKDLLNNALRYKREKLLHSVFSLRGFVYVRRAAEDKAIKIIDDIALGKVVGGI